MKSPIDDWIAMVASLVSPMYPGEVMQALAVLKPHLATYRDSVFTPVTARSVAAAKRFGPVPGWDIIEPVLAAARRDALPIGCDTRHAIAAPDPREEPTPEQRERVRQMLAGLATELKSEPEFRERKLPDVTLVGATLAATRTLAGIHVRGGVG